MSLHATRKLITLLTALAAVFLCGQAWADPVEPFSDDFDSGSSGPSWVRATPDHGPIVCPGVWTRVATSGPPGRNRHSMAYDASRARTVLFGGFQDNGYIRLGDTWEWDGHQWTPESDTGPSPRTHTSMAYDAVRKQVVLFGGVGTPEDIYLDNADTWTWNGRTWTQVADGKPSKRNGHGMAYDSARRRVVLLGGSVTFSGVCLDELWEWNGSKWNQRSYSGGPGPICPYSSIAYDSHRGGTVAIKFTGVCEPGDANETWEWNGSLWTGTRVAEGGFSARNAPALAYDRPRHRLVLHGGDGGDCGLDNPNDTWEWDGQTWLQVATGGPGPRFRAPAMTFDHSRGEVVLFGGASTESSDMGDTWTWTGPIYRCHPAIPGDLNCDGYVDIDDWSMVRTARGGPSCAPDDPRDMNGDGRISLDDSIRLGNLCTREDCLPQDR